MIDGSRTPQSHTLKPIVRKATKMDMPKCCSKCSEIKPLDEFYDHRLGKDGKYPYCKKCVKQDKKQHYKENAEHFKQYRADNKEALAAYYRQYYEANKEKVAARGKRYKQTPKGKASKKNAKHKRREKEKQGDVETQQLLDLQQNATHCYWCGCRITKKTNIHIDHYQPLANGGLHTLSNLVVACSKCNLSKHAKDPIEFAASLGRLL